MKNAALLVSCLGVLLLAVTGFLLLEQNARSAPLPARTGQMAPDTVAQELEKTRSALRRLTEEAPAVRQTRRIENSMEWFPLPAIAAAVPAPSPVAASKPVFAAPTVPAQVSAAAPAQTSAAAAPAPSGAPAEASGNTLPASSDGPEPQLSFIFLSQDFRCAVIDGHFVREGDLLSDGARLVAIGDNSVVVRKGQKRQRIEIPAVFPEPLARIP
jgi:hypothetical protein